MNKSELIKRMSEKLDQLSSRDVDLAVHTLIDIMSDNLAAGGRIEIRGFGTFSNHFRKPRTVRNPKTGEVGIHKPGKFVPHFKPGKELRIRVDASREAAPYVSPGEGLGPAIDQGKTKPDPSAKY